MMILELPDDLPFVELARFLARHGYRLQPEGWESETALFTTVPLADSADSPEERSHDR